MQLTFVKRNLRTVIAVFALSCIGITAQAQTFDQLLGDFAQRRSGTCVIYGHVMAVAEFDPASFANRVHEVCGGWMAYFPDGRRTYVTQEEVQTSISNGYSCGETGNMLTIYSIALSKRAAGFDIKTGQLDYGILDWITFLTANKWTLYDNEQVAGQHLAEGLARLAKETTPDGRLRTPCTMGFGDLDEKTVPKYIGQIRKCHLLGGHDYSTAGYNAANKTVLLRNPHNPKVIMELPIDLLMNIPCGIDFMESN